MALRKRWRWGAVAALAAGAAGMLVAAGGAGGLLGSAATTALRRAGFDGAVATVTGIGLAGDRWALRLDLSVDLGGLSGAGTALGVPLDGRARLSGAVALGWSGLWIVTATPVGCLAATVEHLTVSGEPVSLPEGLSFCEATGTPMLRWSADGSTLTGDARAPRLELPARGLRADGLALTLAQTAPSQTVDLRIATLRRTVNPAEIAPLSIDVRAEQAAGELWRFTGTATGAQGALTATLAGSHDPSSGEGRADLRAKPLRLTAEGPGLKAVSPMLAARVAEATGTLTAKAALNWGADGFRSSGQLLLQKAGGRIGAVTVAGVNGTVALSSLSPLVIPDGQTLAVALLDVGVPLTDGIVRFGYGRDRRLDVDEALWRWAGGTLRADPFELAPAGPKGIVTLHAEGVDLAQILHLIDVEGMDASGTLSGRLPVRIGGDRVGLDGGVLESTGPGTLRYDPAHPPSALQGEQGSAGALLLGALTDFRYESLRLTIDGDAGGELRAGLSVRGANPSFYDGYPVALNLKLSGALDRILRQSLDAYRIPDAVRERMTGFDHKEP